MNLLSMLDTTHAACKGKPTNMFFPKSGRPARKESEAKTVCRKCPIREKCRDYAMNNHIYHGIWGGMTAREIEAQRRIHGIVLPVHRGYARGFKNDA